jgi:hypothetical protein
LKRLDRRTAALGLAAAGAVAAAVVVTVEGRGSSESPAHRSVSAYIKQVDGVQQQLRVRLTKLLIAYRDFTTADARPQVEADVKAAERTLQAVERRVGALEPPPEATRLHRLILRLLNADVAVAHEVTQMTSFMPSFRHALRGASEASSQLATALAAARVPRPHAVRGTPEQLARTRSEYRAKALSAVTAQSTAVVAYCDRLGAVVAKLRTLNAPTVMVPTLRAQEKALVATRSAGLALSRELLKADLSNVPILSRRFSAAARTAGSVAAQKAQIAAIKAYNARVRRTGAIAARIRAEVLRLQTAVG